MRTTSAPCALSPSTRAASSSGDVSRPSYPTATRRLPVLATKARPSAWASAAKRLVPTMPRMSYSRRIAGSKRCMEAPRSGPPVMVLEADDVVLAEIGTRLHFDHMQRDFAGVFQPVRGTERDIGRLVFGEDDLFLAAADLGGALHDHPVLGAVMVHLQGQLAARLDQDVLDLDAVAGMHRLIRAPGPVHAGQRVRLRAVFLDQTRDQPAHLLRPLTRRQHYRILG